MEDEDLFDEWDADYHPFEFDDDSDSDSDSGSVGSVSGSSTSASCYWVDAFDGPSPSQGHASAATPLDSRSLQPAWSRDESTSEPPPMVSFHRSVQQSNGRDSPLQSSVKDPADDTTDHSLIEAAVETWKGGVIDPI